MPSDFDIFRWMDAPAVEEFERLSRKRSLRSGQIIYSQQEPGDEMFRVVRGSVRLTARAEAGREAVFLLFDAGDSFGTSSLVDGGTRPQTAECLTETELQVLDRTGFSAMVAAHPSFSLAVMKLLSLQMRLASRNFIGSSLTSLSSRVAMRLLELSHPESDSNGRAGLVVRLPQSELAALAGGSRQSVNKVLQDFQRRGIVHLSHREILIENAEALGGEVESISRADNAGY